jgi:opacity protein-like surface antigen
MNDAIMVDSGPRRGRSPFGAARCIAAALAGAAPLAAHAQGTPGWSFDFTPYLWGARLGGDTSIAGLPTPPAAVEAPFSDIFDHLSAGAMGVFEARHGRWAFIGDAMYIRLEDTFTTDRRTFGDASGKITQQMYAATAAYRVNDAPAAVDVLGGVRYNDIEVGLATTGGLLPPRSADESRGWTDAIVGFRVIAPVARDWSLVGYVDVGGGGSKFTWQAIAGASYAFNDTWAMKFGYRYLKIDYDKDQFLYDMATQGPYIGVGIRF